MTQPVSLTVSADGARADLRIFDPKGNIITRQMVGALARALSELAGRAHLKLITIEGDGDDFSFGASIPEHAPGEIERALPESNRLIEALLDAPAVTAALVRGRCLGGGFELALACDLVFAADSATFGLPEVALGVFPPAAAALLPARVGAARATAAIVTGEATPARDWLASGLVARVVPDPALHATVDAWCDRHLAGKSAAALRFAARAARAPLRRSVAAVLPALERIYLEDVMRTADAVEGVRAFLEKRRPEWTDR